MQPLTHIIYISKAAPLMNDGRLKELVSRARANNAALGITSVMVQCETRILQILEGNPDTVEAVYGRIARDKRHFDVSLLVQEEAQQRIFDNCALGLAVLSPQRIASLVGATDVDSLCVSELNVGRAKRLLTTIAQGSRSRTAPHPIIPSQPVSRAHIS